MPTFSNFQAHVKNADGEDVDGATITVRREEPGLPLATIFEDNEGDVGLANPFSADADGYFRFYAAGGFYRITATQGGFTRTWFDVPIGTLQGEDSGSEAAAGRRVITGADTVVLTDNGGIIEIQGASNFSLAFSQASALAQGFQCFIYNNSTGDVTLDPNGSETIDGLANWVLYPGGLILITVTATDPGAIESMLLAPMRKQFDASGTFTRPGVGTFCDVEGWGGGGSGGRAGSGDAGGGGGGGGYNMRRMLLSQLGATETVTVGAGGASRTSDNQNGEAGGNTTFGSLLSAFGGGFGLGNTADAGGGGGGGSMHAAGQDAPAGTDNGGHGGFFGLGTQDHPGFSGVALTITDGDVLAFVISSSGGWQEYDSQFGSDAIAADGGGGGGGETGGDGGRGGDAFWGGGGGGGGTTNAAGVAGRGGDSVFGGGGGGGCSANPGTQGAGGNSVYGGSGGAAGTAAGAATAGSAPGGGGGGSENGNSGAGATGRIIVRIY